MDQIGLDDEVMEGRLFGWRWFAALHGPWFLISPTIPHRQKYAPPASLKPEARDKEAWLDAYRGHFNVIEMHDWSYSHEAPQLNDDFSNLRGFHVFREYDHAIRRYAPTALSNCRGGYRVPPTWDSDNVPRSWKPWLMDWPNSDRLTATPILAFVEMSGIIVEHEVGYRVQKIRPVSLYSTASAKIRRLLADQLGWPDEIMRVRKFTSYKNPAESNLRRLEA